MKDVCLALPCYYRLNTDTGCLLKSLQGENSRDNQKPSTQLTDPNNIEKHTLWDKKYAFRHTHCSMQHTHLWPLHSFTPEDQQDTLSPAEGWLDGMWWGTLLLWPKTLPAQDEVCVCVGVWEFYLSHPLSLVTSLPLVHKHTLMFNVLSSECVSCLPAFYGVYMSLSSYCLFTLSSIFGGQETNTCHFVGCLKVKERFLLSREKRATEVWVREGRNKGTFKSWKCWKPIDHRCPVRGNDRWQIYKVTSCCAESLNLPSQCINESIPCSAHPSCSHWSDS